MRRLGSAEWGELLDLAAEQVDYEHPYHSHLISTALQELAELRNLLGINEVPEDLIEEEHECGPGIPGRPDMYLEGFGG